jgi:CRP-like cAMP-binding protein
MVIRKESKGANFLREVNLFDGLDKKAINQIFRLGLIQNFQAGDMVIREGQHGGNLHILINGKAEVVKSIKGGSPKGKELSKLGRGSVFGEMSVFDGAPYSASVKAVSDCDIHIIRGSDFETFLKESPAVAYVIFKTLISSISNRLRRTNLALSAMDKRK